VTPRAYRLLTELGGPLISLYLARRLAAGKEDAARFAERKGSAARPRPPGPMAWIHAASVGEVQSILSLLERLRADRPWLSILVTTGTITSAALCAERLPEGAFHQFVPVDRLPWVRRFLDHWRPDLALWVESELWPNLVGECQRRAIPMVLINGRMSPRSFAGWQRAPNLVRPLLAGFETCFAQSDAEADRFEQLGATAVKRAGNLKFDARPLPADAAELERLTRAVGGRPIWLAASTHPGEEASIFAADRRLRRARPDLLTVLVPRHATRGAEIAAQAASAGLAACRRSAGALPDAGTQLYLADTMGELGLFYRLSGIAFIGGSLVPHGGQNLVEAARLDCAVITGPHTHNFAEVIAEMERARAVTRVTDAEALAAAIESLLARPEEREAQSRAGREIAERNRGTIETVLEALAPCLDPLAPRAAGHARA
jgi:3-deoxy-D-manno-octulosonic-acid transferase